MSSDVEICNLALAHLGDSATVASIDPPEGSAQAEHCQKWYPIARDSLLELGEWNFATTRAQLAELVNPFTQWRHAYAPPADCLKVLEVLPADASSGTLLFQSSCGSIAVPGCGDVARDFTTETDAITGNKVILSNQPNALARYTRFITDTSKFSPLFRDALGWYLASYLAGPVLKGETGIKVGMAMKQQALALLAAAAVASANQQQRRQQQAYPWSR